MLFSFRKGLSKKRVDLQLTDISEELRNGLWDGILTCVMNDVYQDRYGGYSGSNLFKGLVFSLWHSYFKKPSDTVPYRFSDLSQLLRKYFYETEWHQVYDFLEFILDYYSKHDRSRAKILSRFCNDVLERELSGYRFVDFKVTEITSKEEIDTIEEAAVSPYASVQIHIKAAIDLMSDKKKPDFRNSIKESISAVEAICRCLLGEKSNTLGQALHELEKQGKLKLHKAEKKAFESLYGYTSDAKGIRHALLEDEEQTLCFDDAKFMLVSCSAFCNFLVSKSK